MARKLIVCLTGMPGAGKSTIAGALGEEGCEVVVMGDAVRAEAARRGIEPTGDNLGRLMLELRKSRGPGAVAELVEPAVAASESAIIIVDGIRSNAEIDRLRAHGKVRILAVHAAVGTRLEHLAGRGRSDDPKERVGLDARDEREMSVGMSESIALADESVSNNGIGVDELVNAARSIIAGWADK